MKTHHITYKEMEEFHKKNKLDLSKIENLEFGDSIIMEDGQLVGVFTEKLSEFQESNTIYTKENCEKITKYNPAFHFYQSGGPEGIESKKDVYGTRKVVSTRGSVIEQALVIAFDEPTWINLPDNAKLIHADNEKDFSF